MSEEWCIGTAVALSVAIVGLAKAVALLADRLSIRARRRESKPPARPRSTSSPKKKSARKRRK